MRRFFVFIVLAVLSTAVHAQDSVSSAEKEREAANLAASRLNELYKHATVGDTIRISSYVFVCPAKAYSDNQGGGMYFLDGGRYAYSDTELGILRGFIELNKEVLEEKYDIYIKNIPGLTNYGPKPPCIMFFNRQTYNKNQSRLRAERLQKQKEEVERLKRLFVSE